MGSVLLGHYKAMSRRGEVPARLRASSTRYASPYSSGQRAAVRASRRRRGIRALLALCCRLKPFRRFERGPIRLARLACILRQARGAVSRIGEDGSLDRRRRLLRFLRRGGGIVGRARDVAADEPRDLAPQVVRHLQRPEACNRVRRVEVPRILRQPDEIPNRGIDCPGAAKRRTGQLGRYPRCKKCADVGLSGNRVDWRELGEVGDEVCNSLGLKRCFLGSLGLLPYLRNPGFSSLCFGGRFLRQPRRITSLP